MLFRVETFSKGFITWFPRLANQFVMLLSYIHVDMVVMTSCGMVAMVVHSCHGSCTWLP